ncbi:putative calmodulin-binding carboxy-terminal kinesin-like family protein [Besnoitia besnoiti]|uniref:Putative calmodulin-binding carboxy-terminal kinesin-like family protein n=1 Tax=Besnoitia besnoiti TaxID=94643 RepID=A0A2A9MGW1_BESBE|nr:putative calmodulin-binding carboxy-terminal kinesin-like family protein [Besnoitia besnoiti]PFH34827.1 putative calmodulin-binding carboxy-terminal kinesin-like family protein [Besnoitia besnoiti]
MTEFEAGERDEVMPVAASAGHSLPAENDAGDSEHETAGGDSFSEFPRTAGRQEELPRGNEYSPPREGQGETESPPERPAGFCGDAVDNGDTLRSSNARRSHEFTVGAEPGEMGNVPLRDSRQSSAVGEAAAAADNGAAVSAEVRRRTGLAPQTDASSSTRPSAAHSSRGSLSRGGSATGEAVPGREKNQQGSGNKIQHRVAVVEPFLSEKEHDGFGFSDWGSAGAWNNQVEIRRAEAADYEEDHVNAIPGQIPQERSENPTPTPEPATSIRHAESSPERGNAIGEGELKSDDVSEVKSRSSIASLTAQPQRPRPSVKVVVTSDMEEKENQASKRPTFFESLLQDRDINYGVDIGRLDKLRVVSFSGGRVFDAVELEESGIIVKDQKRFVPFDRLREFVQVIVNDMEKMKRQSIDAITEMEWNFRILDQKMKKRCEFQVNEVKRRALSKLSLLKTKVLEHKAQMEYFENQYKELKESFDARLQEFKEQMPRDMQELDAHWMERLGELQRVLDATREELRASHRAQREVGEKMKRLMDEIVRAETEPFDASVNSVLAAKMGDLLIMVRLLISDSSREQVALFLQQLTSQVVADYQEKRAGTLEHENAVLKDACGPEMQTLIEKYEKEIADLQQACEAAQASATLGGEASPNPAEVQRLQNELTVLRAENMILRRRAAGGDAAGDASPLQDETPADSGGADPLIIQDLSRTIEELERQVQSLKSENEQLQTQLVTIEEEKEKGGGAAIAQDAAVAKAGGGAAAKMVQQLQQKNKVLESQVEPMKKRIRELEMAQKRAGGDDDHKMKELEMKLKDAEAENRKQQKQFELELSKSTKGTGMELKKLENQVQKLTERAVNAETTLEATDKQLKDTLKERDGLKKDAEDMKKQMGAAQLIAAEVETLRAETKGQKAKLTELEESYKQEKFLRKKYYNEIEDMKGKIRVYCRVRPMAKYEIEKQCKQSVFPVDEYSVKVLTSKGEKEFMYDRTFPPDCTQEDVYEDTQRLIQSVIDGFNVCIFAYGQTGSGKTFTIQGGVGKPGIAPRAINDLFDTLNSFEKGKFKYEAEVYLCELYNNQLIDLLLPEDKKKSPPALEIKKDASGMVMIAGITMKKVADKETLAKTFAWGLEARHVSGTAMNAESSRSHLIFSIVVRVEDFVAGKRTTGKLSLIDLAGSERVSKSGVTKERLIEAKEINKSLSALGDVISALSSGEAFVPYRNHKLTQVMSDSLGGSAKTLMFVNISPADYNTDETVTSLMYASRVKLITNDASKLVESKQLAALKDKVKLLKRAVEKLKKGEDISDLEKQFSETAEAPTPEPEGPPPEEKDEDFEEPPDLPAD